MKPYNIYECVRNMLCKWNAMKCIYIELCKKSLKMQWKQYRQKWKMMKISSCLIVCCHNHVLEVTIEKCGNYQYLSYLGPLHPHECKVAALLIRNSLLKVCKSAFWKKNWCSHIFNLNLYTSSIIVLPCLCLICLINRCVMLHLRYFLWRQ